MANKANKEERIAKDRTRQLKELGGYSLGRYLWRLLTSMRTALILLLLLGVGSIPGSIFPQRSANPFEVSDFYSANPKIAPWLDRFYFFDVFGAPWFSAIYLLLFISLIGCVVPRLNIYLRNIFERPTQPPENISLFLGHRKIQAELDEVASYLKKRRFRLERFDGAIAAEKGYLKESGNLLFHFSLILLLVGLGASSVFGSRGEAIVNVGEKFQNTPVNYDNLAPGRFYSLDSLQPFQIQVDRFVATYDPITNQALDYQLDVRVREEIGGAERNRIVRVNKPLTFGASRVFLQATGYSVDVSVSDSSGNITYEGAVPFLPQDPNLTSFGAIKIPDMDPGIGMVASFLPTADRDEIRGGFSSYPEALDPRLLIAIWQGDLGMDDGKPQSIYRINTEKMERIALKSLELGESYDFGVGSITFNGFLPWVNLQVIHDPGKPYALAGGFLAIFGVLGTLFIHRRRIWVRFSSSGELEVAGLATTNENALIGELNALEKFFTGIAPEKVMRADNE
jgi:cytochrome c biogenesis protein